MYEKGISAGDKNGKIIMVPYALTLFVCKSLSRIFAYEIELILTVYAHTISIRIVRNT